MMNLAEYRNRNTRLADYLPWVALASSGIVHNHPTHSFRSRRITLNHIETLEKSCVFGIA
ncbi:MAG: hypothetical protein AB7O76_16660 [Rhizobiaceae bacterium]